MFNNIKIRLAVKEDSAVMLGIYEKYIRETAITFETIVPSVAEFAQRVGRITEQFPWFVCEVDGEIAGYAYASKHGERAAYRWSVDFSVYVNPKYYRKNIATALYSALIDTLKLQGYYSAFAAITSPNPNSEAFHRKIGFEEVGLFENVGYKHGEWRNVTWLKLVLSEYVAQPCEPISIHEVTGKEEFAKNIEKANQIIKIDNNKRTSPKVSV